MTNNQPQPQEGELKDDFQKIKEAWEKWSKYVPENIHQISDYAGKYVITIHAFHSAVKELRAEDKATIEQLTKERDELKVQCESWRDNAFGMQKSYKEIRAKFAELTEVAVGAEKIITAYEQAMQQGRVIPEGWQPTPDAGIEGKVREVVGNLHYLSYSISSISNEEQYSNRRKYNINWVTEQILSLISPVTPKAPNV